MLVAGSGLQVRPPNSYTDFPTTSVFSIYAFTHGVHAKEKEHALLDIYGACIFLSG